MSAGSLAAPTLGAHAGVERAAMQVECIVTRDGLRALHAGWQGVHAAANGGTPFNTWEWAWSWWQAYGAERSLRVLVFRTGDVIAGIAPLYLDVERGRWTPGTRVLRLIGDGSHDSDYLGFVVRAGAEEAVMTRFAAWLGARRDWDVLTARTLAETSFLPAALRALAGAARLDYRVDATPCGALHLPASFDAFLRERRSRFRTKLRSLLRKVDEGEVVFEEQCAPRELRARLRSLFRLHQARWQAAGMPGVFGARAKRLFYAHFVPRFARAGWLRLYSLRRGSTYVAHELCFGRDGVTYLLQEGFDAGDGAASYGQTLRAAVIRHLIARGETTYDFLGGASRHKDDWGATEAHLSNVTVARRTWRGQLYLALPQWRARAGALARRTLPAPLVARLAGRRDGAR